MSDDSTTEPAPPGAWEVLARGAIGALLGVVAGLGFPLTDRSARREWYLFASIGLFLGGLAGLAGFVERLGAGRRLRRQLGLTLLLLLGSSAWGLASIFQAEWTRLVLQGGPEGARAGIQTYLDYLVERPAFFARLFLPLGAFVAAPALVRMRGGGWRAQLLVAAPASLGLAALVAEDGDMRALLLILGPGLLIASGLSAWAAGALARRRGRSTPTDEASAPGAGDPT